MGPRFLADEDWRSQILNAIHCAEPLVEIVTVRELGLSGMKDHQLLDYASSEKWLILSHDVNTMKPEAERRIANGQTVNGSIHTTVPEFFTCG